MFNDIFDQQRSGSDLPRGRVDHIRRHESKEEIDKDQQQVQHHLKDQEHCQSTLKEHQEQIHKETQKVEQKGPEESEKDGQARQAPGQQVGL